MRRFPPKLPGLSELNRGSPQQQGPPSAIPQPVQPVTHNVFGLPPSNTPANGPFNPVQAAEMQQQRRAQVDEIVTTSNTQAASAAVDEGLKSQRHNSKRFIQAWHDSGYTFDQLVAEGLDTAFLSGLYRELNLPILSFEKRRSISTQDTRATVLPQKQALPPKPPPPAQPILPPSHTQIPKSASTAAQSHISRPTDQPNIQSAAGDAEKAGSPAVGRQDYIARLMAAKTKKADVASPFSRGQTPVETQSLEPPIKPANMASNNHPPGNAVAQQMAPPSEHVASPVDALAKPQRTQETVPESRPAPPPRTPSVSEQVMAEAKKKAQTALARERMAALTRRKTSKIISTPTAEEPPPRKANGTTAINGVSVPKPITTSIMPGQLQSSAQQPSLSSPATPVPPNQQRATPVSRIPGLSTLTPSLEAQPNMSGTHIATQQNAPANHRPAESTIGSFNPSLTTKDNLRPVEKQPIQDHRPGAVAPVVIELSDDDDEASSTARRKPEAPTASLKLNGGRSLAAPSMENVTLTKPNEKEATAPAGDSSANKAVLTSTDPEMEDSLSPKQQRTFEVRRKLAELELKHKQKAQQGKPTGSATAAEAIADRQPAPSRLDDHISELASSVKDTDAPPPAKRARTSSYVTVEQLSKEVQQPSSGELADRLLQGNVTDTTLEPVEAGSMQQAQQRSTSEAVEKTSPIVDTKDREPKLGPTPSKAVQPMSRRRTEIQTRLPAIEASFANNTSRLEALRAQMRELEESLKREQENKDRLVAELESLGVDTEGMDHADLQETRDEIMAQAPADGDAMDLDQHHQPSTPPIPPNLARSITHSTAASMSISSPEEVATDHRPVSQSTLTTLARLRRSPSLHSRHSSTSDSTGVEAAQDSSVTKSSSNFQGKVLRPDVAAESSSGKDETSQEAESGEVSDNMLASASPAAAEVASAGQLTTRSSPGENSSLGSGSDGDDEDDEEGEVSDDAMRRSDNEPDAAADTYPQQAQNGSVSFPEAPLPTSDQPALDSLSGTGQSDIVEVEDDEDYEPADTLPPMTNGTVRVAEDHSEAVPGIETQGDSDVSVEASSVSPHIEDITPANREDQLLDLPLAARYKPYKSVLRSFTATRPGDERSATDASKIDPNVPLCQYEASGGICNDSDCDDQHFEPRATKGSVAIKKLGLSNPGKTQQERNEYHLGLFDLMTDLKVKQADADHVIREVTRFRQRFVQDPLPGFP